MMIEAILDIETTGLLFEKDRVVEIACIELNNHIPTKNIFHTFISPDTVKVSQEAFEVHGYSDEFLADKPKFKEIAQVFLNFIKDKTLIIHNADFDLSFINNEFKRLGIKPIIKTNVIDTLQIARSKFPGLANNLDALCKRFKINNDNREKHSALLDCNLLAKIYIELIDKKELILDLQTNLQEFDQNVKKSKGSSFTINISEEQKAEYKKFLKKNVPNSFANSDL